MCVNVMAYDTKCDVKYNMYVSDHGKYVQLNGLILIICFCYGPININILYVRLRPSVIYGLLAGYDPNF